MASGWRSIGGQRVSFRPKKRRRQFHVNGITVNKTIQTAASAVIGDILPANRCLFAWDGVWSIRFDSILSGPACAESIWRNAGLA
jgi:hypothetical protein